MAPLRSGSIYPSWVRFRSLVFPSPGRGPRVGRDGWGCPRPVGANFKVGAGLVPPGRVGSRTFGRRNERRHLLRAGTEVHRTGAQLHRAGGGLHPLGASLHPLGASLHPPRCGPPLFSGGLHLFSGGLRPLGVGSHPLVAGLHPLAIQAAPVKAFFIPALLLRWVCELVSPREKLLPPRSAQGKRA